MATAIHHGAPGSFKSFALVQRFAIEALKEGRVVVSNIRGFHDIDLIKKQFPDVVFPPSAEILALDSETKYGRALMAGWFHWVPFRALILIDEGQRIYPDRRDFKLESLDRKVCPDGYSPEQMAIARPEDVFTAFDMQRHYQWDIFISTTNVAKIQRPIREVAEYAYLHKSLSGKLPFLFKNTWYEFQHDPENNGKTLSNRIGKPRKYKADERIFKCYQSTATGQHTKSNADQNILGDAGVRFKLGAIVLSIAACIFFLFRFADVHDIGGKNKPDAVQASKPSTPSVPQAATFPASQDSGNAGGHGGIQQAIAGIPALNYAFLAIGQQDLANQDKLSFLIDTADGIRVVHARTLIKQGFAVRADGLCHAMLYNKATGNITLTCEHDLIQVCSTKLETPTAYISRGCKKLPISKPADAEGGQAIALNNQ